MLYLRDENSFIGTFPVKLHITTAFSNLSRVGSGLPD